MNAPIPGQGESAGRRAKTALGVLGIILSAYIWVQKASGFSRGCWGLEEVGFTSNTGCQAPALVEASVLWGVPLAAWGMAFCFSILAGELGVLKGFCRPHGRVDWLLRTLLWAGLGLGLDLLSIQKSADAWCPLCLILLSLIAVLVVIDAVWVFGLGDDWVGATGFRRFRYSCLAAAMLGGGYLLGRLGLPQDPGRSAMEVGPGAFGRRIDDQIITSGIPLMHQSAGKHRVVAFLDPNCPHCPAVFQTLSDFAQRHPELVSVRICYRPIFEYSLLQCALLEVAKQEGRYYETWRQQFQEQRPGQGWTLPELSRMYEAIGVHTAGVAGRIQAALPRVLDLTRRMAGERILQTPAVFVDGYEIAGVDLTVGKLAQMVGAAAGLPAGR